MASFWIFACQMDSPLPLKPSFATLHQFSAAVCKEHQASQGSYSFELFKFYDIPWPFPFFKAILVFFVISDVRQIAWSSNCPKSVYARGSMLSNLPLLCSWFDTCSDERLQNFPWLLNYDFPGLENEILNCINFQISNEAYEPFVSMQATPKWWHAENSQPSNFLQQSVYNFLPTEKFTYRLCIRITCHS